MLKVLITDDQSHVLDALELVFEMRGGLAVERARTPAEALDRVRAGGIGVVVHDMNFTEGTTSGQEGVRLFRGIRELDPQMPVVLMTAWASLELAVDLVKQGADDYLQKPWNDEALLKKVQNLLRAREHQPAGAAAPGAAALSSAPAGPAAASPAPDLCGLLFESAALHSVVSLAVKVAAANVPVLITGPNGAGKEKIAEIVQANSPRRERPFIKVNAGALPDELFSAELFGSEAGAFTGARARREGRFELADGGTLFLDEIGNLSLESQAKLLRALQSGEFERLGSSKTLTADVRVIAATNVDLKRAIAEGPRATTRSSPRPARIRSSTASPARRWRRREPGTCSAA
jgi:DNA-binding NtrC family response regulator